ncbi:diguanylate cyclase [Paraneptunicella aestuarii]|uniref:ligand-binding sensor domain-containing diguanylate cyclase n=1 Tax=Paraneptunicella aestuarii TaxID=2831148 RepID=UPI001E64EB38|nr:ligand-binding sensor domain-containing diguanylate cyclase [Paraneptunicella aestuarii]UAA38373.1 diguanylate cyclase [Paraneptunicella aestuarii]
MRFDVYDIDKGLVQETVRGIIQDNRGFLWIATEEGLNRFDGFTFTPFRHNPEDATSLSNDVITDMVIDSEGYLWIGTFGGGLNRFDPQNTSATRIAEKELSSDRIQSLFIDSQKRIWVGTFEHGLDLIIPKDGGYEFVNFKLHTGGINHPSITAFAEDTQGRIWVGSDGGGVDIYDPDRGYWQNLSQLPNGNNLQGKHVRSMLRDKKGNIWIGTASHGLHYYQLDKNQLDQFTYKSESKNSLSNNRVLSLLEDNQDNLWVGTDDGITMITDEEFIHIKHSDTNPNSLSNNRILSMFQDANGLIWLGTYRGLNKWNPTTNRFNHTLPKVSDKYNHSVITGFAQYSNQDLVIATYGGGVLKRRANSNDYELFTKDQGLPDNRIMALYIDKQDGLWIGTRAKGLAYLPNGSNQWRHYEHDPENPDSLPANGVTDILQDQKGDIWVTTYKGGLSLKIGDKFKTYSANSDDPESLSSNKVMQIHEDQQGQLWLATEAGLNLFNPKAGTFTKFRHDPSIASSLTSDMVWQIFEDSGGNFWIATEGNGINLWQRQERIKGLPVFKHIQRQQGLLSNTVYGFAEDTEGRIWMSSNKGLSRYNPKNSHIEHFDKSHGLQGYDFNIGAVMKGKDDNIYFGGSNGFNQFSAHFDPINSEPPNVELIGVSGLKENKPLSEIISGVTLAYNDYLVAFDFVALDFAAPEKNQYQYKLEHFDADWVNVGNLRRATYTNLPAGKYTFMVKASNNNGTWSESQINLPVTVEPAPWLTIWAFGLYAAIISGFIMTLIQIQLKKFAHEENQRKKLEQEVAQRTKELAEQNKKLTALNNELEVAYRVDALTGLNNRHFLNAYLGKRLSLIDQAHMTHKEDAPHMLIMLLDMDNLKPINDNYGHAAGDAAICHLARLVQERIPQEFHLIRWGGDEFMLVGEIRNKQETCAWIENLYEMLDAGNFFYFKQKIKLSCSAGFAFYPFDHENPRALSWDQVSMVADKALYSAKMDKGHWCGVVGPTREINELYLNELLRCKHIKEVSGLVNLMDI